LVGFQGIPVAAVGLDERPLEPGRGQVCEAVPAYARPQRDMLVVSVEVEKGPGTRTVVSGQVKIARVIGQLSSNLAGKTREEWVGLHSSSGVGLLANYPSDPTLLYHVGSEGEPVPKYCPDPVL
jgi:hypothetical protein